MPDHERKHITGRRDFLRWTTRLVGGLAAAPIVGACRRMGWLPEQGYPTETPLPASTLVLSATPVLTLTPAAAPSAQAGLAQIAFVRTRDREEGVRRALAMLDLAPIAGQTVLLKPNFNSDDPPPASTHPETLHALIEALQGSAAGPITVADRSGMGDTRLVMANLGIYDLAGKLGCEVLAFDELADPADWQLVRSEGDHWQNGFPVPRRLLEAGAIVTTCCLKPHRFGGHFTLSLKNSVGMVGKTMGGGGYNYMSELHNSPYQRLMIAEANAVYDPALVVLDGVEAFIDNGPEQGTRAWGEVVMAGTDRVALDAAGLALLRHLGYNGVAAQGPLFAQEQLARAVELGLGVERPEQIAFLTDDTESAAYAAQLHELMLASG